MTMDYETIFLSFEYNVHTKLLCRGNFHVPKFFVRIYDLALKLNTVDHILGHADLTRNLGRLSPFYLRPVVG